MLLEPIFVCFIAATLANPLRNLLVDSSPELLLHHSVDESTSPKYKIIPIVKSTSQNEGDGSYSYSYEGANNVSVKEHGDAGRNGTKARGSYSFTLPDGQHVSLTYTADENGFVAEGTYIPTPHPIPEAILKALEENVAAEARGIFDDGQYHGEGLEEGMYREELVEGDQGVVVNAKSDVGY
ncbi:endocuticle structural glycoprotein SgAbd-4-like [Euwallacea similis]|uniref:endocuticle structural glycoprotein SgAbd-4-like n=1 Tax=Euwallacea similis TaxID=1736056 RepID=UPI00344F786C